MENIPKLITKARNKTGLSQSMFGKIIGKPKSRIYDWEREDTKTNIDRDDYQLIKMMSNCNNLPSTIEIKHAYTTGGRYKALYLILEKIYTV